MTSVRPDTIRGTMVRAAAGTADHTFTDSTLRTQRSSYRRLVHDGPLAAAALSAHGVLARKLAAARAA